MKHIFILNPSAGKGYAEKHILPKIRRAVKDTPASYRIHRTMHSRDAINYTRAYCEAHPEEHQRFYAVGGDGTLNEVANGLMGFPHAELGFIPAGTGNDFVRMFPHPEYFADIQRQIEGDSMPLDLLRYNDRYCVNMVNIGLDCDVVDLAQKIKKKTPLRGTPAYLAGIAVVFWGNRGIRLAVTTEEESLPPANYTLAAVGNGSFCGGGFKNLPQAQLDDGLLDVVLIRKVTRRAFASLLPYYQKGTYLDHEVSKRYITHFQGKRLQIVSEGGRPMKVCVDGEVEYATSADFEIIPHAIRFSLPKGCE